MAKSKRRVSIEDIVYVSSWDFSAVIIKYLCSISAVLRFVSLIKSYVKKKKASCMCELVLV